MSNEYILPKVDCQFFDEDTNPRFCMVLKEAYCFKERCRFYKTRERFITKNDRFDPGKSKAVK